MEVESFSKMQETKKENDVYQCSKCGNTMKEKEVSCSKCGGTGKVKMKTPPSEGGLKGFFS